MTEKNQTEQQFFNKKVRDLIAPYLQYITSPERQEAYKQIDYAPSEYQLEKRLRYIEKAENIARAKQGIEEEIDFSDAIKFAKAGETNPIPKEILEILTDKGWFNKIAKEEISKKVVGEEATIKVIMLCAYGGRLVKNSQIASFNLLVNDDAGVGKDYTASAVLSLLPKESYIHKTRISPTVFTYWKPVDTWDGVVFYPEDVSEGVLNSDVFKVMCSNGSSATITVKQKAVDIEIKGKPVMITTTASATPNPELTRRFVILNMDSSDEQTKRIMERHSEFKEKGLIPEYNLIHTEAMKYLKRVKVKIPFARQIDKYFPTNNLFMRTNYPRFLDFISASAAFHQYQRKIDVDGFILTEKQDYELARECFLKLCSNKYMIALTNYQKRILGFWEKEPNLIGSAQKLHSDGMNFIALKNLINNLQKLVSYGFLQTKMVINASNKEIMNYHKASSYNPQEKVDIPNYEQIMEGKDAE